MLPETTAAPDHVFPEARLTFMDAGRDTLSQRRAVERGAYTLFVHRMAGLMQRREQYIARVVLVDVSGDAHVAGRKARAERMMGKIKSATVEIVAQALSDIQGKFKLGRFGKSCRRLESSAIGCSQIAPTIGASWLLSSLKSLRIDAVVIPSSA